jgi:fatty-acyl-CoA synthase
MPLTDGEMQPYALTLNKFLEHAAKWHPSAEVVTALGDGRRLRVGYAELMQRSLRISGILQKLGIASGDRVATLAWNSQAHVEAWYAIMGIGAVCHTLNPRLTGKQLASMAVQSDARIIFVSRDLLPLARQIAETAPAVEHLLVIDAAAFEGDGVELALEPLIATAEADVSWGGFDETAPSGLCFTSGTTGAPKGVTYTHRSSYLHTLRLLQTDTMAISGTDKVLAVVPMFHANAWGLPFALPAVGGTLVLPGRFSDGESIAKLINAEGVTVAVGVPTIWLGLVDYIESSGGELPTLERIIMGGAPLAPALMQRIERRLGVKVQTSWGMTELSPLGTIASLRDGTGRASLSGRPAIGVDLMLSDADGIPVAQQRNTEGHLHVRGSAVVERYFGHDDRATDNDGWFATGDLARIDDAGNLMITGRAKDLIKSGGEWINPAEIEAVVGVLPEVSLAAVIGRPDAKWGERPILLVETRDEATISDEALLAPLHGKVAPWWIPDAVYRLPNMPLASTGKIDKIRLRAEFGGV